jgi:DNA topoisomerase VI subunit B
MRGEAVAVEGDADWLKRLVLNLLDNSIKFTPRGGRVVVDISREDGMARLQVQDNGIGIERAATPHIFERFFRADPARSSGVDGAGLGLSLMARIARSTLPNTAPPPMATIFSSSATKASVGSKRLGLASRSCAPAISLSRPSVVRVRASTIRSVCRT